MVRKNVNVVPMKDPSQSSRGWEKTQVIVTSSPRHILPACRYLGPLLDVPSSLRNSTVLHSDLGIAAEGFKQTLLFRSGFQPVDIPWSAGTGTVLQYWPFLTPPHRWICLHDSFSSPHAFKSFFLGAHTHLKFIGTESPRKPRHRPPCFYARCQTGANAVCSYS